MLKTFQSLCGEGGGIGILINIILFVWGWLTCSNCSKGAGQGGLVEYYIYYNCLLHIVNCLHQIVNKSVLDANDWNSQFSPIILGSINSGQRWKWDGRTSSKPIRGLKCTNYQEYRHCTHFNPSSIGQQNININQKYKGI